MKFLLLLLVPLAFAAPLYEFDPDCVDEDQPILEPEAYGMGVMEPSLVWDLGNDEADVECEDEQTTPTPIVATKKQEVTEECEDPLTDPPISIVATQPRTTQPVTATDECIDPITEPAPVKRTTTTTQPPPATDECEDPLPTTKAPIDIVVVTDECEDQEAGQEHDSPFLNFHIEKAEAEEAIRFYEDNKLEDIEECDDF